MKKIFIATCAIFLTCVANSQPVIRNASFENWTTTNGVLVPDNWGIYDSAVVISKNALKRQSGGTVGTYSLFLGAYTNIYTQGARVGTSDSLSSEPGGIAIDFRTNEAGFGGMIGLDLKITFYDASYLKISEHTSNTLSNNSTTFAYTKLYFSFPVKKPKYYELEIINYNTNGFSTEYVIVDNVRFLAIGAGMNETEAPSKISVFPNPATDFIKLKSNDIFSENIAYRIFTTDGKLINEGLVDNSTMQINTKELNSGVYLLSINNGNGSSMTKFIKE